MHSNQQARRLIEATHRAALDPTEWAGVVAEIQSACGNSPIALYGSDDRIGVTAVVSASGFDPDFVKSYFDHYIYLSPWNDIFPRIEKGRTHYLEAELSPDYRKTEFYNDWLRPQGDLHGGAGLRTRGVNGRSLLVGLNVRARDRERHELPGRRLLAWLEPHLTHALAVNEAIARLTANLVSGPAPERNEPSKQKAGGMIFVTHDALITWADGGAVALFGDLLRMSPLGRLQFVPSVAQDWFEETCRTPPRQPLRALRVFWLGQLWTLRASLCGEAAPATPAFAGLLTSTSSSQRSLALTLMPHREEPSAEDRLRQVFGLSAAEAAVALALAEGLSTATIADLRQTSLNTVRNQIQSLLFKLGAGTRTEAVRIIQRGHA